MDNLIDTNENSRQFDERTRKVESNNNDVPDFLSVAASSPQSTIATTTTNGSAPPRCLSLNGLLHCVNNGLEPDVDVDASPMSRHESMEVFHNDGLIEEIFQLPSDDEVSSNSDNCVYAYRGANIDVPEPHQAASADDETDFLEMDFDPEPNSEVENFNDEHFNHLEANFFSLQQYHDASSNSPKLPVEQSASEICHPSPPCKETGAKPKQRTTGKVVLQSPVVDNRDEQISSLLQRDPFDMDELPCLECAEAEFLRQTKLELSGETRCPNHRRKLAKKPEPVQVHPHARQMLSEVAAHEEPRPRSFMVTIYSVGCDYDTIVDAITSIGAAVNTEMIRQYFDTMLDEETATMSVPEYLLYVSKRGCNYKKLMDLIRVASLEPLDIHFYPVDPLAHTPDLFQVEASEITSRWNPNTDLRNILRFKNRHFRYMNVLGKVIHVIRQSDRSRQLQMQTPQQQQSTINIPQYYKSGYICITKSRPTWP